MLEGAQDECERMRSETLEAQDRRRVVEHMLMLMFLRRFSDERKCFVHVGFIGCSNHDHHLGHLVQ